MYLRCHWSANVTDHKRSHIQFEHVKILKCFGEVGYFDQLTAQIELLFDKTFTHLS